VEVERRPAVAEWGGSANSAAALARLGTLLWSERLLLRRVRSQSLLPSQLRASAARLAELEVLRAMESELLAETLGLPPTATLAELAAAAPDPWATILADHRGALLALSDAVAPVVRQRSLADYLS
jgi:hypothetical protein